LKRILVTYATMSGTTAEVARKIAEELTLKGYQTMLLPLTEVTSLEGFDTIVLGAPMIVGWHRDAVKFLKTHQVVLAGKPLALFATAMTLTQTGEKNVDGVPVFVDEKLALPPQTAGKLTFKERYSAIPTYVRPMLTTADKITPVSVALFGGRLDIYRLKWWAALFVMVIIRVKPGEKRNWQAIKTWADSLV